jgi:transaldolase
MATATLGLTRREALTAELARDVSHVPARVPAPASDPALAALRGLGTEIWLDTGNLEEASALWRREMSALTTNNTLANAVVQTGIVDDVIKNASQRLRDVEPGLSIDELVLEVGFVVNCQIALRLVSAFDALVSVELHPAVGHDMEKTLRYAQRYYAVDPDRFIVKIPWTPEGICAVARARADGIPINYTLGFSARQNYLAALVSKPNYVNVFLGRLNAVVSDNGLGDGKYVGEKATLASQKGVRELREAHHDIPTHQIAASMRNAEQMVSLAGVDVYTVPPKAMKEFLGQNHPPASLKSKRDEIYDVTVSNAAYVMQRGSRVAATDLLWTIDDNFKRFAAQLAARGGTNLTGNDLRQADRDFGTRLFTGFTPEEQAIIRKDGKIPQTAKWLERAALDDLMTESALQSFITDQGALDDRIKRLVAQA